jgi:murein DD-endopeptidase MepM/ murein hydrolase activator NlpD
MTTTNATAQGAPRPRGGLLDVVLAGALCWAVYASTPLGAIAETAVRVARGQKDHPSWFATFRGRDVAMTPTTTLTPTTTEPDAGTGTVPAAIAAAAQKHRVDVDALAALVVTRGSCDEQGRCTAVAPDRLAALVPGKTGTVDVDDLAKGLARAKDDLATTSGPISAEAAVEALFVGAPAVRIALSQAARSALPAPDDVEVHAPFLSPATRRGPLQGALVVLQRYRLRTLAWPGDGFAVTSSFGDRIHPVTGEKKFHNGTDIGMPVGTALPSAHDGTVRRAGRDSISGNYVVVDHGLGIQTSYCHLSDIDTAEHARVRRREVLGRSGATGRVTGPHLHYVLRIGDRPVDAETFGEHARGHGVAPPPPSLPQSTTP